MNEEIPSDGTRNFSQRGFKFVPTKDLDNKEIASTLHFRGRRIISINMMCFIAITEIQKIS